MRMGLLALSAMAVGAAACGGGSSASATFTGTIHGQNFAPKEAISATTAISSGSTSTIGVIVVANNTGLCHDVAANQTPKNLAGLLLTVGDVNTSTGASTAPTAPGVFTISSSSAQPKSAFVAFEVTDASCKDISAQDAVGASGTVTLTSVSGGAYAGSFDVVMDSGDHVTGSFSATNCASIGALFGSSTSTATCI